MATRCGPTTPAGTGTAGSPRRCRRTPSRRRSCPSPGAAGHVAARPGTSAADAPREIDAAELGSALAAALFTGEIGFAYAAAVDAVDRREGRGLRLTLSLAETPELLDVPWEFLYRRPTFLAVQPHLPLVRHVEVGPIVDPPVIEDAVRILGVVASPQDLAPLDVAAERRRVEQAVGGDAHARAASSSTGCSRPRRGGCARPCATSATTPSTSSVTATFRARADGSGEGVLFLEDSDAAGPPASTRRCSPTSSTTRSSCSSWCSTRARARARRWPTRSPAWRRRSSSPAYRPSWRCSSRSPTTRRSSSPRSCTPT